MKRTSSGLAHVMRPATLTVVLALAVVACGSSNSGVSTGRADSDSAGTSSPSTPDTAADATGSETTEIVVPSVTEAPPITEPSSTGPTTTLVPITLPVITTAPTTTAPPPSTTPGVPGGWVAVDSFPPEVVPPLDESNQTGVPSPALPTAPGQPLADGIYDVQAGATPWSPANPNVLDVSVHRYEACTVIPDSCISYGDPFAPDELGIEAASYDVSLPLTGQIGVGLTGYDCQAYDATGNGADLAALFTAFDASYSADIAPLLGGADNPVDVLSAAPAGGFTGENPDCSYGLLFKNGGAPPLLLQSTYNESFDSDGNSLGITPLSVTDEMHPETLQVVNGVATIYLYAGFFS
ncbi:MAG: hypothetical protein JWL72_852 [Ilumatobacteraceae bacterium]|nr:hypothetical protein [Ilumatobacteraceae bacterium]